MRILVCAAYTPFPPAGGGRADIWRRIEAFTQLGHSVMLLHQYDGESVLAPTVEAFAAMDEVLEARFSFPVRRGVARAARLLIGMGRRPWPATKAVPTGADEVSADAAVRAFQPDVVWLDGPWLGVSAKRYSTQFDVPLVYRSHNVEHVYMRRQAKASSHWRHRIVWTLATIGLKRYELGLMRASRRVLDISLDDLAFWEEQGVRNAEWLPPLPELAVTGPPVETIPGDIVFVGGLRLPNNVRGVRWLVDEVLPLVHEVRPELTVSIVGSSPKPELAAELAEHASVRAFFDVPSVHPHLFGAKVLVNPVAIGSGVQLKMLDMLMTNAPIVTRSQGVRGLPSECIAKEDVQDTAAGFATSILRNADATGVDVPRREHGRRFFTVAAVGAAIADL